MILIKIRHIQLKKEVQEVGAGVLLFLGILWVLIYTSYTYFQNMLHGVYIIAGLFLLCLNIQFIRKDKSFVYNCIENPWKEIYVEYVLLTFPVSFTVLFTPNWILYPCLLIALTFIPLFKYSVKQKTYLKKIARIISPTDFELISIFRKSFLYIIPIYTLALALSWYRIFPLVLLWFVVISILSGYAECEPLTILKETNLSPSVFLKQKFIRHSKYLIVFMLPIVIVNIIFNPEFWLFNLLFVPTQLALLAVAIFLKYSNYEPNRIFIGNNLPFAFVSLTALVPYMLPIPLLMAVVYYQKAKHNLTYYL